MGVLLLGVLFLSVLFLNPYSWILVPGVLVLSVRVLDITLTRRVLDGLGSRQSSITVAASDCLASLVAYRELWLARYSKGCFVGGSVREVEDIFLSDGRDKGVSKDSGRVSCGREASASRVAK